MMDTTRRLREEHRVILKVLDCFEIALAEAGRVGSTPKDIFGPFVEFFHGFADRCHHCKEEDRLFPCLERCGIPREGGPIGVMIQEHELGRAHVRAMAEVLPAAAAGDARAVRVILTEGEKFLDLLRHHIMKEDHVLFNMADSIVPDTEKSGLLRQYADAEAAPDYRATDDRCREIAARLCERYGVAFP